MGRKGGFPGGGMGNMGAMMKQAQKMQVELARAQEEIKDMTFEASAGGGMVTARVNGSHQVLSVEIKPEAVDPDDVEMLQDMVVAAVNAAFAKATDSMEKQMAQITGGMNLPGGLF